MTQDFLPVARLHSHFDPPSKLTAAQFQGLCKIPAETEWFANLTSMQTRRAYKADLRAFMAFIGIVQVEEFRTVTRSHVLAWRRELERLSLGAATIRRKLAALSSLFDYLCENNAVSQNPTNGVKRPAVDCSEGKTPALSDAQARQLLEAPSLYTLKGQRDRAILSILLFHGLRRDEVTKLRVKDFNLMRSGIGHLMVHGKGKKIRFIPLHPETFRIVMDYLQFAGHGQDSDGPLFRRVRKTKSYRAAYGLSPGSIYANVVIPNLAKLGIKGDNMGPHVLRVTAATCALQNSTDIARVQNWLGHSNISTTRLYDRRSTRPEDSPTYRIHY